MSKNFEIQDTKDTSSKKVPTENMQTNSDYEIKSSSSTNEEPKTARDSIKEEEKLNIHQPAQKKEAKGKFFESNFYIDTVSLTVKPPTGKHHMEKKNQELKPKIVRKPNENLLSGTNDELFSLLDNPDWEAEFITSISSTSSQMDYDNMAIEAMAEINSLENADNSKETAKTLHDYKNNKWSGLYNKRGSTKDDKDKIHMIEEDIENEIDSDYSMTLKKEGREYIIQKINKEIDADNILLQFNLNQDCQLLDDSNSSLSSIGLKLNESSSSRRTRENRNQSMY